MIGFLRYLVERSFSASEVDFALRAYGLAIFAVAIFNTDTLGHWKILRASKQRLLTLVLRALHASQL